MKYSLLFYVIVYILVAALGCKSPVSTKGRNSSDKPRQKECIEKVITLDSSLGATRDKASRQITLSQSIRDYIKGMEAMSFTGCPQAFTTAFQHHIAAWRDLLPLTDKYPELRGELHELFTQLEKGPDGEEFKRRLKAVWDTWAEVEAAMKS